MIIHHRFQVIQLWIVLNEAPEAQNTKCSVLVSGCDYPVSWYESKMKVHFFIFYRDWIFNFWLFTGLPVGQCETMFTNWNCSNIHRFRHDCHPRRDRLAGFFRPEVGSSSRDYEVYASVNAFTPFKSHFHQANPTSHIIRYIAYDTPEWRLMRATYFPQSLQFFSNGIGAVYRR
jgi:hypothetical protein